MGIRVVGKKTKEIFSEDNGRLSSMRVLSGLVILIVLGNWTWHNVTTGTLASFDLNELMLILGPLGVKAWQKGREE